MIINRRSLITGLISFIAAPAIVRAGSLMRVNPGLIPTYGPLTVPGFYAEIGPVIRFRDNMHNTGSVTLNVNGYVATMYLDGKPIKAGDLVAGETYVCSKFTTLYH